MTPPDNTEQRGADAGTDDEVAPPWQRVAKDVDAVSESDGDGFGQRWSSGELPADEASYQSASYQSTAYQSADQQPTEQYAAASAGADYSGSDADTQVVSGTAAGRLFGGRGPEAGDDQLASPEGVGAASGSGGGSKRSTPVSALRRPGRGPRRASLQVKRFDPWSVLKLSLVLGVALFFIWLVAVGVLYTVLEGMGVWDQINGTYTSLVQGEATEGVGDPFITAPRVFGIAAIVGAVNIVLISALTTVSAFIYNVSADLAGGLEVTLSERE
ncbi:MULTISPECIES: DUF3566 domain-containing protein [Prauserella salsuginis group]|uniref:DUF3566 domain-containing protein n=2 Tax=Prauserella salsuginis group TaxID=2893672 RepID=A0A839XHF2_9PSEU|nr:MULTISPECIES: DUF3566 domain-containing protein [Prauserella salsuginis group]MBB3662710.1 hypothetical protein [Prauserella sediminis]MCR3720410.1 Transmembrane protein of unknown function (DUF3566) [Prauserella flava]MCR3733881.1 Transmembrane protein of unknown function (DUF3566) [Prauserella salsuginis]